MNFKQPTSDKLQETATSFGGIVLGSMASRGVIAAVHTSTPDADEATAKKEKNMLLIKRAGLIVVSGVAAASINGTDTASLLAKMAFVGMAGMQAIDVVKDMSKDNPNNADTSTTAKRVKAAVLGLGCGCEGAPMQLASPVRRRALRMPMISTENQLIPSSATNALDQAVQSGATANNLI